MATVTINDVRKTYANEVQVIQGLSAQIEDGEFVVIVGPSGCGKSTLLRMVAGLESCGSGELLIDGRRVNDLGPAERDIAMVFQNYALYPHMTVFDNMAYGLKIRRLGKGHIEQKVTDVAATLGLTHLLKRHPKHLSGGQRQRVAMGRAIVRDPKVFLFDEPLSNLDAKLRVQMRLEIQRLHQRLRTTSLYVTHDQVEAMTLADRIIVMNLGKIEQQGTPQQIFDAPASTFVASFMGSPPMNLLTVQINDRGQVYDAMGQAINVPSGLVPRALWRKQAILGLRPEHLQLAELGLLFTLEMIEVLGSEQLWHGTVAGQSLVLRHPYTALR
nr:sn-glycerol-3-phosphate ABC transporter ATP-binding protein UgpC [Neisseriaceae bacterium]